MKVEQLTSAFQPVTITFDTLEELAVIAGAIGHVTGQETAQSVATHLNIYTTANRAMEILSGAYEMLQEKCEPYGGAVFS